MIFLGIDPGVMTGYCSGRLIEVSGKQTLLLKPVQVMDDVDDLWRRLIELKPRHIIMESFEFRQKSQTGVNLFPVQLIGVARFYSLTASEQCAVHMQTPAYGKAYYSDKLLKSSNLYIRGVPHGMDALRHLLQWWTFGSGFQYNNNVELLLNND